MDDQKNVTIEEKEIAKKEIEFLENSKMILEDKVRLDEIEIRIQEINVILENEEFQKDYETENRLDDDEYFSLVDELKALRKEKKTIIKKYKNSPFDRVPVWIIIYASIQLIVNFYYSMFYIVLGFIELLSNFSWMTSDILTSFVQGVIVLIIPVILLIVSLCIWLFGIKDKFNKKVFLIAYLLQIVMTVITIVFLCIDLYG